MIEHVADLLEYRPRTITLPSGWNLWARAVNPVSLGGLDEIKKLLLEHKTKR